MAIYIGTVLFILFMLSIKYPATIFWLGIFSMFDIGGYLEHFSIQLLTLDVSQFLALACIFFPLFSPKLKSKNVSKNQELTKLLKILILFTFYHIIIYGFLKPLSDINDFFYFIVRYSPEILGPFSLIPAYLLIRKNPKQFYYLLAILSLFYLVSYFITVYGDYYLMPIISHSERFSTEREILPNFIFLQSLIPLVLLLIISKLKYPLKKLYILLGILMVITVLMSLSRLRIIVMVTELIIAGFIISNIYNIKLKLFTRIFVLVIILGLIIVNIVPQYYKAVTDMYTASYNEFFTQKVEMGTYQTRTKFEIPMQYSMFQENIFFGTGYDARWYGNGPSRFNGSDTPFMAGLAMFGIIGISIYLLFYIKIFFIFKNTYHFLKKNKNLLIKAKIQTILILFAMVVLFVKIINVADFFKELLRGEIAVYISLILGMLLALKYNLKFKFNKLENQNN